MLLEPAMYVHPSSEPAPAEITPFISTVLYFVAPTCTQPGRKMLWHFMQKWLIFIHKHVLVLNYKRENSKWTCHVGCFVLALPYPVYTVYTGSLEAHDPTACMSTILLVKRFSQKGLKFASAHPALDPLK